MHKFFTTICLLLITITIANAGGEKEVLFPELSSGLYLYRYNWDVEPCVLYVAEMSRTEPTLHFEVALANAQVLGKETVRSMANRRNQRGDRRVLVATNGGFGVLGDMRGYGGVLENLHIQDGELITQPTDTDACFGVTESGEFLSTPVKMEASIQIGTHTLSLGCINQRRLDGCEVTLYTPRLGESTRTNRRRGIEAIISGLALPLTPNYAHPYRVEQVSRDGNSLIPRDGAILWFNARLKDPNVSQFSAGAKGSHNVGNAVGKLLARKVLGDCLLNNTVKRCLQRLLHRNKHVSAGLAYRRPGRFLKARNVFLRGIPHVLRLLFRSRHNARRLTLRPGYNCLAFLLSTVNTILPDSLKKLL